MWKTKELRKRPWGQESLVFVRFLEAVSRASGSPFRQLECRIDFSRQRVSNAAPKSPSDASSELEMYSLRRRCWLLQCDAQGPATAETTRPTRHVDASGGGPEQTHAIDRGGCVSSHRRAKAVVVGDCAKALLGACQRASRLVQSQFFDHFTLWWGDERREHGLCQM